MENRVGYLTVFSADRREIYGSFCDADWTIEKTRAGSNHVFSGIASEGALETFRRIDYDGISHVCYRFESNGYQYEGSAQLLAPEFDAVNGSALIRIESGERPVRAG